MRVSLHGKFTLAVVGSSFLATSLSIAIITEGTEVFWFSRSNTYSQPPSGETGSTRFEDGVLHIQHPIIYLGKEYGRVYMGKSTQSYIERIDSYIRLIAWLIPGLLFFSFIFAYWLKRFFTTPIAELATIVNKIALENAFDRRVHTDRDDEIGQLYTDFNKLLQTVNMTQKNLADQNYALDQSAIVSITNSKGVIIYVNDNYCKLYA